MKNIKINREEREREVSPVAWHCCWRPSPPGNLPVIPFLSPVCIVRGARTGGEGHLLLRAGGSSSSLTPCLDDATLPRLPLALSLASSPPLSLSHTHGRRHRRRSPRPQPPPRLSDTPTGFASSLSSSSPSRPTPEAPGRRKHRRSPRRPPEIAAVNSPSQKLPRAH